MEKDHGRSSAGDIPLAVSQRGGRSARIGKTVYVRKEYHERIQLILRVIGKDEVSLFSYIDNVLAHHFDMFQEDIKRLYEQNNNIF